MSRRFISFFFVRSTSRRSGDERRICSICDPILILKKEVDGEVDPIGEEHEEQNVDDVDDEEHEEHIYFIIADGG